MPPRGAYASLRRTEMSVVARALSQLKDDGHRGHESAAFDGLFQ